MTLEELGYNEHWEAQRQQQGLQVLEVGRVIAEHRERYQLCTADNELEAEILGQLRYSAVDRSDFPAVGDWVAFATYDEGKALIHAILPRQTVIERQAVGKQGEKQVIAANVDYALLVQAADRDFNLNRLERYLTICRTAKVSPIVVLNKIDLVTPTELARLTNLIQQRVKQLPVMALSNLNQQGLSELEQLLESGKTYCLLGSSGVGKSTLLNHLCGKDLMRTNPVNTSSQRGRHSTTHRELIVLPSGAIFIDNPGMREVGIADASEGLEHTFSDILALAEQCKFKDCTHQTEIGCAVLEAIEKGEIDPEAHENYLRMRREEAHFRMTMVEKREKDRAMGKLFKNYKKSGDFHRP